MSEIIVYVDEDSVHHRLVIALRSRGVSVVTALDAGLRGASDERHLEFAAERGCVVLTFNVGGFYRLHTEWLTSGRDQAGIILSQQQCYSIGEMLRRILRIHAARTGAAMRNQAEFLSNWGERL